HRERRVEERQEVGSADRGNEARIVGFDDVRGERGLDVGAEREGKRHGADGFEGRSELVDLEQREEAIFTENVVVVDVDDENGGEGVEGVRATGAVEAEAEAEAEA